MTNPKQTLSPKAWKKMNSLVSMLHVLQRCLQEGNGAQIHLDRNGSYTDGIDIWLKIGEEDKMISSFFHENGHLSFTDFSECSIHNSILYQAVNVCEDVRIDAQSAKRYAGYNLLRAKGLRSIFAKMTVRQCSGDIGDLLLATLLAGSFNRGLNDAKPALERVLNALTPELAQLALQAAKDSAKASNTFEVVQIAKRLIESAMEEQENNSNPESSDSTDDDDDTNGDAEGSDPTDGDDDTNGDTEGSDSMDGDDDTNGDAESSDSTDGDDDTNGDAESSDSTDGDDDTTGDAEGSDSTDGDDDTNGDAESSDSTDGDDGTNGDAEGSDSTDGDDDTNRDSDLIQYSNVNASALDLSKCDEELEMGHLIDENNTCNMDEETLALLEQLEPKGINNKFVGDYDIIDKSEGDKLGFRLKHPLRALQQQRNRVRSNYDRFGCTIAEERVVDAFLGEQEVFRTDNRRKAANLAVTILTDVSASMEGGPMAQAALGTYGLMKALESLPGVVTEAFTYGSGSSVGHVKSFQQKVTQAHWNWVSLGGTDTGEAMQTAIINLSVRQEERRMLFVITDGVSTEKPIHAALAMARGLNIQVVPIVIGKCPLIGLDSCEVNLRVNTADELPAVLQQQMRKIV